MAKYNDEGESRSEDSDWEVDVMAEDNDIEAESTGELRQLQKRVVQDTYVSPFSSANDSGHPSPEDLRKGKPLDYRGYRYNCSKDGETLYWTCARRNSSKCKAAFACNSDGTDFEDYKPQHNHSPGKILNDGSDKKPGTKYGLPADVFNAMGKKQRNEITASYWGRRKPKSLRKSAKNHNFIPDPVRQKIVPQHPITSTTAHFRCTACGCCVPTYLKNTHIANCILSFHEELVPCTGGSTPNIINLETCTCNETDGRVVENSFRGPALLKAMQSPQLAAQLHKSPVFEDFKKAICDIRAQTTGPKAIQHNVYIIVEVDQAHRSLSFAEMTDAAFYAGESLRVRERAIKHFINSASTSPNSAKSQEYISRRVIEALKSNGRKRIFLIPLTIGGHDGQNFVGAGKDMESLTMLVMGMPTLVNTTFTMISKFNPRIAAFFKHADVIISSILYTTWKEVFVSGQLTSPRAYELTNPDTFRSELRGPERIVLRALDDALALFSSGDYPRHPSFRVHPVTDYEHSTLQFDHQSVRSIMDFTVADEREVQAVINSTDVFFDAACVTRLMCVAALVSGKKAVVVNPIYTSTLLNGLQKPDDNSLRLSSFNYIEDPTVVLIPFSTSTNDNGNRIAHWTLFIADRESNALVFYDPLGNTSPCYRQFNTVRSILRDFFYHGDELLSQSDELAFIACGKLRQNIQPDGSSCGVYVSELAGHYLISANNSYSLPAASAIELRKHATTVLKNLEQASFTSTGLHFTPLTKWLAEHRYPTEDLQSPETSRDSGVCADDVHPIDADLVTSSLQPPQQDAVMSSTVSETRENSTAPSASVGLLIRISRQIYCCRERIKRLKPNIAEKTTAMESHARSNQPRWKKSQIKRITFLQTELTATIQKLEDFQTTRLVFRALWDYYANRPNYGVFESFMRNDTFDTIEAIARFWGNEPTEARKKAHAKLPKLVGAEFKEQPEKVDLWLKAYNTVEAMDTFFAPYACSNLDDPRDIKKSTSLPKNLSEPRHLKKKGKRDAPSSIERSDTSDLGAQIRATSTSTTLSSISLSV